MKYVVVGVENAKGSFKDQKTNQDISYDNILLHCFTEDDNPKKKTELLDGHATAVLKVKNDFNSVVVLNGAPVKGFVELMGCEVKPYFNQYGRLDCISVVSIDGEI